MNTVIIWGAGAHSIDILNNYYFPMKLIEGVVDSDEKKLGSTYLGKKVQLPKTIGSMKSRVVLIGTEKYFSEVKKQLEEMNTDKVLIYIDDYLKNNYAEKSESVSVNEYAKRTVEKIDSKLKATGGIKASNMQGAMLVSSRYEAIDMMPKNMVAAEIGVAYGDFSEHILTHMEPSHFYAIDFFNKDNPFISFWGRTDFEDSGLPHEEWYKKRFSKEIESGKMSVCSGFSWDCLEKFEDDFFDYIYLDACHDYESVVKDIEVVFRKVKHGGYIQFNDYTLYDMYLNSYYGVVPAVNDMIAQTDSQVIYYCLDTLRFDDIVVRVNKSKVKKIEL